MSLDLGDLEEWPDEELMEALNEIDHGLTEGPKGQIVWIERFNAAMHDHGELSSRRREVAEKILREWNDKYG